MNKSMKLINKWGVILIMILFLFSSLPLSALAEDIAAPDSTAVIVPATDPAVAEPEPIIAETEPVAVELEPASEDMVTEDPVVKDVVVEEPVFEKQVSEGLSNARGKTLNVEFLSAKEKKENNKKPTYVEGEVIVKFKDSAINLKRGNGASESLNFANSKNLEKKEDIPNNNLSVLKAKKDGRGNSETVEQMIDRLKSDPNVEYVQPNFQYYPSGLATNDTYKDLLWGLDNTGQTVNGVTGTNDSDIDAPEAWAINEGTNSSAIVAIIDSGVAYNHPDLAANMWDGTGCVSDTNTALGGCVHGYDFKDNDKIPLPTTSRHGTHIAGTIGAVKNNSMGILGVAPNVKIMALKSNLTTSEIIKAINFAKYNGATVINASWGTYSTSGEHYDVNLYNAIKNFSGLFIVAAGNEAYNHDDGIDAHKSYPDGFTVTTPIGPALNNIIVVAATNQNDALTSFSDYGSSSVHVGAPGENIYSTVINDSGSNVLTETFEGVTPPNNPAGWTANGNWGTINATAWLGAGWGNVLYGDVFNYPYAQTANSTITSSSYNISGSSATMDFWTMCDTEYNTSAWTDYMALEFSSDGGSTYSVFEKWDEPQLDYYNGDSSSAGSATYHFEKLNIPSQYLTNTFKFRLRWVANGNANTGNGDGCLVDDIVITRFLNQDGSAALYGYLDGTSMAAPHVAGLAALIKGFNPTLTDSQIKNIILTTGDSLASLSGKTVTGKRINAYNALQAANPAKAITSFTFTTPVATGVINEAAHTISITVPSGTDVTALIPAITITGASVSPLTGVVQNFTSPVTYTVTAGDSSTQAYVATVTVLSNIATVTSGTYTVSTGGTASETITNIPYGTSKTAFLAGLTKGQANQTWNTAGISDPVVTGNTLAVTAQDGITIVTYTVTVNASSNIATITSATYTVSAGGTAAETIINIPYNTAKATFLAALSKGQVNQTWNTAGIANPVVTGNTLVVTAQDGVTLVTYTLTVALNPAKVITAFSFPEGTGVINEGAKTIAVTVPFATDVTALTPTIAITGASVSPLSGVAQNFTNPVTYTVTAADASTQAYVVTVTFALNTAKAITSFNFTTPAATGVVNEGAHTIAVTVPYGTVVTALVPTITITGASVNPASGVARNFTTPVTYTVTAANSTTQSYVVTVTVALNPAKAITTFNFASPAATGVINEGAHTIALTVPYGTNVTALVPTIVKTGVSVSPASGVARNFTTPVTYTVTAADSTTQAYVVTVTVALNPAKTITSFNFTTPAATGVINQGAKTIALSVPYGTDVTALIPTIAITGASVNPASGVAQNFTSPVTYTVTAADSTTQAYIVTVTVALNPAKAITSFTFTTPAATGVINEAAHTIAVTVPYGTSKTALVASFISTGASVKVGTTLQTSGVTVNNFTNPVTYKVTAADSSTQSYVVTVIVAPNPAKAISSFNFASPATTGVINEGAHTIALTVPYGTNVTALVPTIVITGASVSPASGIAQNFTNPVTYTVTAADSTTQAYVVTVTVALNPAKAITSFNFTTPAATGVINQTAKTIALTVPYGNDVTALVPTIVITGSSVSPVSGVAQNFTSPVTYTVTAADSTTQTYVVTVSLALNPAKAITSFNFASPAATGVINEGAHTIAVTVPYGTVVTALVSTITITGASVSPASGVARNFTNPVTYTVTAANSTTQAYVVTVTVAPNTAKAITSFNFVSPAATGVVNEGAHTIAVTVPFGTSVIALAPSIAKTGASVSPASGVAQDFSIPITYTVTAADSSTQAYVVTVTVAAPSNIATITSLTYTVSAGGTASETIINIPYNSTKATFLAALTKGQINQTWDSTGIADPVVSGGTLVVTAQDGITIVTYTATVNAPSNIATITSATYTVSAGGTASETIINIPYNTTKVTFLAALTKGQANQTWNTAGIADPVVTGNTLVVTAQDGITIVTYTVTVALNPAKAITSFNFTTPAATGVINQTAKTIAVTVPNGTIVTALVPTIGVSGVSVSPASGIAQNFTSPVIYTVTAADATTQIYTVTVTVTTSGGGGGGGGSGIVGVVLGEKYVAETGLVLQDPAPAENLPAGVTIGTLVKRADMTSVYFIDQDNRRHAFPNEATYLSWFSNFDGVQTISAEILAAIPLGSNVTVRPGTWLVKIQSDPKVYAVESYGVLRWIESDAIAQSLFGTNWGSRIKDVDATFFTNYQVGTSINSAIHPLGSLIVYSGDSNIYYIENGLMKLVSPSVFSANLFQEAFINHNIDPSIKYTNAESMPELPIEVLVSIR